MPFDSDVFFRIKRRWKEGNIYEYEKQINYSMPPLTKWVTDYISFAFSSNSRSVQQQGNSLLPSR